jgi:hypothetical protein
MCVKIEAEVISRRTTFWVLGMAVFGMAMPAAVLTASDAEAQTAGTERRQERRTNRTERRQERRTGRTERRQERRTGTTGTGAPGAGTTGTGTTGQAPPRQ